MASREKKVVGNKNLILKKDLDHKTVKLTSGKQEGVVRKLGRPPKCKDLQGNIVRAKQHIWIRRPKHALGIGAGRPRKIKKLKNDVGEEEKSVDVDEELANDANQRQTGFSPSQSNRVSECSNDDSVASDNHHDPGNSVNLAIQKGPVIAKKRFKKRLPLVVDATQKQKKLCVKVGNRDDSVEDNLKVKQEGLASLGPPKKALGRPRLKVKRGIKINKLSAATVEVRNGLKVRASPYTTRSGVPPQLLRNGKRRKFKEPVGGMAAEIPKTKRRRRLLSTTTDGSNVDSLNDSFVEEQAVSRIGSESDSSFIDQLQMENGAWDEDMEMKPVESFIKDGVDASKAILNGESSNIVLETSEAGFSGKSNPGNTDELLKKTNLSRVCDGENDEVFLEIISDRSKSVDSSKKNDSNSNLCLNNVAESSSKINTRCTSSESLSDTRPKSSKCVTKKTSITNKPNDSDRSCSAETTDRMDISGECSSKDLEVVSLCSDRLDQASATGSPNSFIIDRAITPSDNWETMSVTSTPSSKNFDASFEDVSERDTDCENGKDIRRSQRSSIRKSRAALIRLATSGKRTGKTQDKNVDLLEGAGETGSEATFISPSPDGMISKDIKMEDTSERHATSSQSLVNRKESSNLDINNEHSPASSVLNTIETVIKEEDSKQYPKPLVMRRKDIGCIERRRNRVQSLNTQDIASLIQSDMCVKRGRRASDFNLPLNTSSKNCPASENATVHPGDKLKWPRKFKLKRSSNASPLHNLSPVAGGSMSKGPRIMYKSSTKTTKTSESDSDKPPVLKPSKAPGRGASKLEHALTFKDSSKKLTKTDYSNDKDEYSNKEESELIMAALLQLSKASAELLKMSTGGDEDVVVIEEPLLKKLDGENVSKVEAKLETETPESMSSVKSLNTDVLRDEDMAEKLRELSKKIESESDMFPSLYIKPVLPISLKTEPNENLVNSEPSNKKFKGMPVLKREQKCWVSEPKSKQTDLKLDAKHSTTNKVGRAGGFTKEILSATTRDEIVKEMSIEFNDVSLHANSTRLKHTLDFNDTDTAPQLEKQVPAPGLDGNSFVPEVEKQSTELPEKDSKSDTIEQIKSSKPVTNGSGPNEVKIVPDTGDDCLKTIAEDGPSRKSSDGSDSSSCPVVEDADKPLVLQPSLEEVHESSEEVDEGKKTSDVSSAHGTKEETLLPKETEESSSLVEVVNEKEQSSSAGDKLCVITDKLPPIVSDPNSESVPKDQSLLDSVVKVPISSTDKRVMEEETPENIAVKETILSALGLLSLEAAKAAKIAKSNVQRVGMDNMYTGTLKTIIKVQRSPEKRTRPLKMILKNNKPSKRDKGFDSSDMNGFHYSIFKEAGPSADDPGTSYSAAVGNHISSNPQLFVEEDVPAEPEDPETGGKEGEKKQLVIPEKASSFSIHPSRLCSDVCSYCFGKFGSLDTPCHIAQLKGNERQVNILQAELHLTAESCLCDACYRHVDRKANCPTYREKTKGKKRLHHMSRAARPKATCCVLGCVQTAQHHIRRKWLTKLKRSIGKKVPVINNKLPPHVPLPLCSQHYAWVDHFMICGICRRRLNCNQMFPLGPEVHEINSILVKDRIPVSLVEKLFLCKLCRYFTSLRTKFTDKTKLTGSNKMFYESYRKKILQCLDVEVTEDPEPVAPKQKRRKIKTSKMEVNGELSTTSQEPNQNKNVPVINLTSSEESSPPSLDISSLVETQLVEPMIDYSTLGSDAPSVMNVGTFGRPTMPSGNYRVEPVKPTKIRLTFGNSKPGPATQVKKSDSLVILERDPEVPKFSSVLETPQLSVSANFDFRNPLTVKADCEGEWEKCAFTLQYDRDSKQAFEKLKRPYGSQSSFFRHLLLLEQYWRSGELVAAPTSNSRTKSYLKSVQNRIDSFSMSAPVPKSQGVPIIDLPLRRMSGGVVTTAAGPSRPFMTGTNMNNPMFVSQVPPTKKYVMNPATGQYVPAKRKPNIVQVTKGGQPLFRLVDPTKSQIRALQGYKRKAPSATVTSADDCVPLICDVRSLGEEGTKLWSMKPAASGSSTSQPVKQKVAISILPKPPAIGPKPNTVVTPTGIILSKKLDISVVPIMNKDDLAKS